MVKREVAVLAAVLLVVSAGFAPAQDQAAENQQDEEDLFVAVVFVNRVYSHSAGYRVVYQRSNLGLGEAYLPSRWFLEAAGKGDVIYTSSPSAPYMEVYYSNGSFSHVRLHVRRSFEHPTWGRLTDEEAEGNFDIETLTLRY